MTYSLTSRSKTGARLSHDEATRYKMASKHHCNYGSYPKFSDRVSQAKSVNTDQTSPEGAAV